MASTGDRRAFLKAAAASPLALAATEAAAVDYAGAAEVLAAIERLEDEVDARFAAVERAVPAAGTFAASVRRDRARHRARRREVRRWLGLPAGPPGSATETDPSLDGLRAAQQALVHAHAEGLPALGDRRAVDRLAADLVDLARQLAVIDLWIELEEQRG